MRESIERRAGMIAITLIAIHAALLILSAARSSVTVDEAAHLPAGLAYLRYGEFSMYNYNPPLLRMMAAAPVMLARPLVPDPKPYLVDPPQARFWHYAKDFERANWDRIPTLFFIGRMGMIPISCLGAWLVFAWARSMYGPVAGLLACTVWVFEPDILAHGSLFGTDLGAAVAMMAAIWAWQRFCATPSPQRGILAGVATGIAHCCKFSAILLWPAMLVMLIFTVIRHRAKLSSLLAGFAVTAILSLVLVNLCYGYSHSFEPMSRLELESRSMQAIQRHAGNIPIPLPRQLLLGIDALKWESEVKLPAYLLGETYTGGRWDYYPIALASKLPIGALALLLLTSITLFLRRPREDEIQILLALLIIAALSMFGTNIDLGVRYLLPIYPLAMVLVARLWTFGKTLRVVAPLAVAFLIVESLLVCPRYLTFLNVLAGGPSDGWKIVNDSNFDWGQGLIDLKQWQDAHHAGRIELAYWGVVDPAVYGIEYVPFGEGSDEQFVAISSYFLVGQRQRTSSTHGELKWMQIPYFERLQQVQPIATPSGTIFVFTRQQIEAAKRR